MKTLLYFAKWRALIVRRFISTSGLIALALIVPGLARGQFVLTKVADTNTAIPNGSGNFTGFTALYGPVMSQGSVAFYGTGNGSQKGYYIQTNGVLFRAVDTNTIAPGGAKFIFLSTTGYGFEANSLYFIGASTDNALFSYSNGVITKLLGTNTTLPGTTNKFTTGYFVYPFDGRVAVYAQGASSSQRGIYLYDAGVVTKVADTNDNYIGGTGKLGFTTSSADFAHDANGAVAFFTYDASNTSKEGIFVGVSNTLIRIASTDTTVPGRTNLFGGTAPIFSRKPDLSEGKVVFSARYSGGGSGVFLANLDGTGGLVIADTSTQIPGTNVNFASFAEQAIELGTVVFTATGSGIYGAYRYQNGVLDKIVAKPDLVNGKQVQTVVLGPQGLSGGRVALQITFADGTAGIYTAVVGYANQSPPGGTLVPGSVVYSKTTGFSFQFIGELGRAYRVQYSTNLSTTNWTTLTNFTYAAPLTIADSGAVSSVRRVYRAISP